MALVHADYCFTAVDIGSYGSNSDGGIFPNSLLGQGLATNQLNLPPPVCLPGGCSISYRVCCMRNLASAFCRSVILFKEGMILKTKSISFSQTMLNVYKSLYINKSFP